MCYSAGGEVAATFGQLRKLLSADLVAQIGAVYQFELTGGGEAGTWYMDLASAHWWTGQLTVAIASLSLDLLKFASVKPLICPSLTRWHG